MKTFKKWNHKHIQDDGITCSQEYKSFARAFKDFLKRNFPEATLDGFRANHYDLSGFVTIDGKTIYIRHDLDRNQGYVDFDQTGTQYGVLYRAAKDNKDFHGGCNNFCSIYELVDELKSFWQKDVCWKHLAD